MLPLTGDIAARFEEGSDRSVGRGRAQHPVDCQGSWGPAAHSPGVRAGPGRCWPRRWAMLTCNMSRRFLRNHKIDLMARKSWCESNDPNFTVKAADVVGLVAPPENAIVLCVDESLRFRRRSERRASEVANGRASTGQSHDYKRHGTTAVCGARGCDRKGHRGAFKTPPPCRVPRLHGQRHRGFSGPNASRHPRQSQHTRRTSTGSRPTPM
ncbi:hypothetical protein ABMB68_009823 [Bradyrhizobium sp. RT4a]